MHTSVTHYNNDYASLTQSRKCHYIEEQELFLSSCRTRRLCGLCDSEQEPLGRFF